MLLETLCVKTEVVVVRVKEEAEEFEHEETGAHVMEEAECEDNPDLCELYMGHQIKDELVLSPVELHRPCVLSSLPASLNRAEEARGRACSVRLERLLVDAEQRSCRVGRRTYPLPRTRDDSGMLSSTTYQCAECGEVFRHKSVLRKHIHSHSQPSKYLKKKLPKHSKTHSLTKFVNCIQCNFSCKYLSKLLNHQRIHAADKPFACSQCDYKCRRKSYLHKHERIHTGEKPFKCSRCSFKCNKKINLQAHETVHTGVKPYKCDHCEYACSHKPSLRIHQRKHNGEKPFACNTCDYKCSRKADLVIHHRTHTGEKPFHCTYCDYKSSQKKHLRSHQMIHTGEKPYKCNDCDYRCSRKTDLRSHQARRHSSKKFVKCTKQETG